MRWGSLTSNANTLAGEMANGFVQQYKDGGWISRWSSPGYANLMVGTSSDVAFADAYLKGVPGFDVASAYQAALKNANGKFVTASVAGATAAAAANTSVSPTNFSITNEPGDTAYPIAGFSWVILSTAYTDAAKGRAVVYLFKWLVSDGQKDGTDLQYAPLPTAVQNLALTNLKLVKAGGAAILS